MKGKVFIDTNILVYAHTLDEKEKHDKILVIFRQSDLFASTQILREFVNVMVYKLGCPIDGLISQLDEILDITNIVNEEVGLIYDAIKIGQKYKYRFYDSLVIAAALKAGCNILLSEDMHHGQIIDDKLTITNPFY